MDGLRGKVSERLRKGEGTTVARSPPPGRLNNISYWNAVCMPAPVRPLFLTRQAYGSEKVPHTVLAR